MTWMNPRQAQTSAGEPNTNIVFQAYILGHNTGFGIRG